MSDGVAAALASAIDEAAAGLEGVDRVAQGAVVELRRDGRPFARVEPEGASFRVGTAIAVAAMRTPGVTASALGNDWVELHPGTLDRFALDRATSWTELAWRLAAPER